MHHVNDTPSIRLVRNPSSGNLLGRNASSTNISGMGARQLSSQDLVKMSELIIKCVDPREHARARSGPDALTNWWR